MLNKLIAIIRKDVLVRFSGRTELLFFLVLPIIFTVIVGGGIPEEDDGRLLLPVVDLDRGAESEAFLAALAVSETVRVEAASEAEAVELFDENDAGAYLIIPEGFGEGLTAGGLLAGGRSEVILRVAAGSNIGPVIEQEVARAANARARPLQAALQSVRLVESIRPFESEAQRAAAFERALESAAAGAAGPARVEFTAVGAGETFDASAQASAGNLITWVFIPLLGASGLFVSERLLGTLQRQLTTPTRRSTYLAGSIGSQFLIALAQMIILILFGIYVMKVPWGNSPAALMVVLVAFGLAGVALGTALGTFVKSETQATNLSILFGMAMALLGGCWFPMELFPAWLQQAAKILPTTWAMTAMTDLTMRGGGMADILPESAVLLGFAVVFFVIGVRRFRYD